MSKVAIVLLNYNSSRYTKACVRSIRAARNKKDDYVVVVWDNNSDTPPLVKEFGDADLVVSSVNDGFSGGYNKAVKYAISKHNPDYLLILNNDTRVTKGMISELIDVSKSNKDLCLVSPKIYFEHGHEFHKNSYSKEERGKVFWYTGGCIDWPNTIAFHRGMDEVDRGHFNKEERTSFVTGCCILLTPKIWKRLKGFDERYFLYFEDVDLSIRAAKLGIKLIYAPKAQLFHINAGSTSGGGSSIHQYYQTRNTLLFGLQYGKLRAKLALLSQALRIWKTGNEMERLGVLHAMEGKWGKMKATKASV